MCCGKHAGGEDLRFKICSGEDLCLVCRSCHGGADLAGDYLDADPLQQLIKQGNTCRPHVLPGNERVLLYLQDSRFAQAVKVAAGHTNACPF